MSLDDLTQTSASSHNERAIASKQKRSLSWLLPVGLLLGFLLIFYLLFGERMRAAITVDAAPVITIRSKSKVSEVPLKIAVKKALTKGELLFQASGWVEPDPYTTYVSTLVDGVIREVHALEGQTVKKGDLLARLVADDAQLDLEAQITKANSLKKKIVAHCSGFEILKAEKVATVRQIEAQQASLNSDVDVYQRLKKLKKGVVSTQRVVQARTKVEQQNALLEKEKSKLPNLEAQQVKLESEKSAMEAQLEELKIALKRAKLNLERTKIYAPMDGVVLQLHAAPGMKRMLNMDSPTSATIVELYNPEKLQARIDVALNEASALSVGQPVELVSDLLPDQVFEGVVTRIKGQADLQRNTLQAKVEIKNPDSRLKPGMLMRAKFFASGMKNSEGTSSSSPTGRLSLYVAQKAIMNDSQVWVISSDSTAELRTITLGKEIRDDHQLVTEGLKSGELVILPPHDQLKEGSRVIQKNKQ